MNTKNMTQEQISAFADSELADTPVEAALAALRQPDGRATWDAYHHIGDVLRSDEMGFTLSQGFAGRMAARLEAEPTIIAPVVGQTEMREEIHTVLGGAAKHSSIKRFAMPGMVAAAVAALTFVATPQFVAMKDSPASVNVPVIAASATQATPVASHAAGALQDENVVLRDPRIDEYLLAHQRFSPSVFSTAQYARSATFAIDSDK